MTDCTPGDYPTWCFVHEQPAVKCAVANGLKQAAMEVIDVFRMHGHTREEQIQIAHTILRVAYPDESVGRRMAEAAAIESEKKLE